MLRASATMSGYEGRLISAMATPVSTAVLKAVPLFASVPEEQLRMLTVVVTRKSVSRSTTVMARSEEHTSELQSPCNLVCRLLLEKKKKLTIFENRLNRYDQIQSPYSFFRISLRRF